MPTVLGHLLNQNINVFGWEYLFCRPTRTIQQIVKTIWWYIYGSNYSFTGSCFMYIYTIYWLKQTLPLIKFVKISKISCFYFSMVLYFKTVYFPLISKIYNRKQTQGFDVAMDTIYFDQGIAFVNKLTSNVTFNLLFWSQRSLTMSDLSFLFVVYLKLEEIKDNKRHLLKRYCNPVARDYVKSNFNQILVTANNIKFKISWNGSLKWGF